jgi:hypothetical protein
MGKMNDSNTLFYTTVQFIVGNETVSLRDICRGLFSKVLIKFNLKGDRLCPFPAREFIAGPDPVG